MSYEHEYDPHSRFKPVEDPRAKPVKKPEDTLKEALDVFREMPAQTKTFGHLAADYRHTPAAEDMEIALWERNEGKRVIKVLHAEGAKLGNEHAFLCDLIKRREVAYARLVLKGQHAPAIVDRIVSNITGPRSVEFVSSGSMIFRELILDGSTPGKTKKYLVEQIELVKSYEAQLND